MSSPRRLLRPRVARTGQIGRAALLAVAAHALVAALLCLVPASAEPERPVRFHAAPVSAPGPTLDDHPDFPGATWFVLEPDVSSPAEPRCKEGEWESDRWRYASYAAHDPTIAFGRPVIGIGGGQFLWRTLSLSRVRELRAGPRELSVTGEDGTPEPPGLCWEPPTAQFVPDGRTHLRECELIFCVRLDARGRVVVADLVAWEDSYEAWLAGALVVRALRFDPPTRGETCEFTVKLSLYLRW